MNLGTGLCHIVDFHAKFAKRFQRVAEGAIFFAYMYPKAPSTEGALLLLDPLKWPAPQMVLILPAS